MIDWPQAKIGQKGFIVIGIPGPLEPASRLGIEEFLTWLAGQQVEADLQAAIQRPARIENDAACVATPEAVADAGKDFGAVFADILARGTDTGNAVGGRSHRSQNTSGGEWDNTPLTAPDTTEMPDAACFFSRFGDMEAWISDHIFEGQYALHSGRKLKAWATKEMKRNGDKHSGKLWDRSIYQVVRGLAATGPRHAGHQRVRHGSSTSNVDELYQDLPPALAKRTFSTLFHTLTLRDASGVRGAAPLRKN